VPDKDQTDQIIEQVESLEEMRRRLVEGGRRGGQSTSDRKREAGRRNAALARTTKEMYRKFPILRQHGGSSEEK